MSAGARAEVAREAGSAVSVRAVVPSTCCTSVFLSVDADCCDPCVLCYVEVLGEVAECGIGRTTDDLEYRHVGR